MRRLLPFLLACLLWAMPAWAAPVACNGISSTGAVTMCNSGQTYAVTATTTALQILASDSRTSFWYQNNGANQVVIAFGDVALNVAPYNGILLQATAVPPAGNAFYWTNMPQGNTPGIIFSLSISVISIGGPSQGVFMYTH